MRRSVLLNGIPKGGDVRRKGGVYYYMGYLRGECET